MADLNDVHRRVLSATGTIVAGIGPQQWNEATPCEGWDVRALANHVVAGNYWAAELAAGKTIDEVGTALDGDVLGDDAAGSYEKSAAAAAAAFEAPGALDAPCAVSYGPVPGSVYAGHRIIDVLVHGWDLAKATGQDTTLDPDLVAACIEIVEPQLDMLAASGAFAPATEVGDDADPQARLLGWLGR
ncbi:MAG TPA: TIGR03086 family metal-binding protein [Mycobacteriales bacterium]|nr:TIGR03086 family metal-binding protein [Mycobacteriales bacterium]